MVHLQQLRARKLEEPLHASTLAVLGQVPPQCGALALLSLRAIGVLLWVVVDDVEMFALDPAEETDPLGEDGVALEVVGGDGRGGGERDLGGEGAGEERQESGRGQPRRRVRRKGSGTYKG